ncbi:hypothetical protein K469DRAFT_749917 [Zopfia rhizophila CBS 207.26]|uniref:Uncharacterized protein n=1 Tax=Zopfia rhizophila CBS 207.26 TaxID=1314779 RepID=A0A6A6E5A3_9PEZI|nr:hypothetical protein K469DRAFT_749917 [Zopfia rhizophila CBS 207.26]
MDLDASYVSFSDGRDNNLFALDGAAVSTFWMPLRTSPQSASVPGAQATGFTGHGLMHLARAMRLTTSNTSDRDLHDAGPPILETKTASNAIPLGTRKREQATGTGSSLSYPILLDVQSEQALTQSHFREFAKCIDHDLNVYITKPQISPGFLSEVDMFLRQNPGILKHCPEFVQELNFLPPLKAYKTFLKGYTRPARYITGVPDVDFTLTQGFIPQPLATAYDEEIVGLFQDCEYRDALRAKFFRGPPSNVSRVDILRKINYFQTERMPYRHLGGHVVLSDITKSANYTEPEPDAVDFDSRPRRQWKYCAVRYKMGSTKEQGVAKYVLKVLVNEYGKALIRKGYKRTYVNEKCREAERAIDHERCCPTGVDVVDMIMNKAYAHPYDNSHSRVLHQKVKIVIDRNVVINPPIVIIPCFSGVTGRCFQ